MQTSWGEKAFGIVILALLFPLCSYVSQVINMKIAQTNMDSNDPTSRQMRTMNLLMPFMSLFISFTVPLGLTVYWIAGAVVRSIQQAALNKHFDKIDLDSIIEKNKDKAAKKQEQRGIRRAQIYNAANMNTKNTLSSKASSVTDNADKIQKANELRRNAKSGSLSSKANLVNEFNNRNTKK
jgi:YidC/Oxa1 family membrane protein insertase